MSLNADFGDADNNAPPPPPSTESSEPTPPDAGDQVDDESARSSFSNVVPTEKLKNGLRQAGALWGLVATRTREQLASAKEKIDENETLHKARESFSAGKAKVSATLAPVTDRVSETLAPVTARAGELAAPVKERVMAGASVVRERTSSGASAVASGEAWAKAKETAASGLDSAKGLIAKVRGGSNGTDAPADDGAPPADEGGAQPTATQSEPAAAAAAAAPPAAAPSS